MTGNRTTQFEEKLGLPLDSTVPVDPSTSDLSSTSVAFDYDMVTVTMEMRDSNNTPLTSSVTAGPVAAMANSATNGGRHVRRPSMQFNFVFVIFPAIFGLALAL